MRFKIISILLICLFLCCSCSQNDSVEVQRLKDIEGEYKNKLILMEQETNLLKQQNNELITENTNLKSENSNLQTENSKLEKNVESTRNLQNDINFQWMIYKSDWDNIKIKYNSSKSEINITSCNLMPFTFIGPIREGWAPERMDQGICKYEFFQKDISYEIEIFKEHVFKYQNQFYYCEENLLALYNSFTPASSDWLKTDNILNLIYNSNTISIKNNYYITDRTKNMAKYISSFQVVESPNKNNVGKLQDVVKYYNHGEIITISIYDNYLSILYKNVTTWYKGTEGRSPYGIISIFTAD